MYKELGAFCTNKFPKMGRPNLSRAHFIDEVARRLGIQARSHYFNDTGGTRRRNIVVRVRNGKPEHQIAICAHYDKVEEGDGAIDNGSGVVVTLSLLEEISREPGDVDITFLFFDAEEIGLQGSRSYIRDESPLFRAVYNIDTVGVGDTIVCGKYSPWGESETIRNSGQLNERVRVVCERDGVPYVELGSVGSSDHTPFSNKMMQATMVSTMSRADAALALGQAGGCYKTEVYRTINGPKDTYDKIEPSALSLTRKVMLGVIDTYRNSDW